MNKNRKFIKDYFYVSYLVFLFTVFVAIMAIAIAGRGCVLGDGFSIVLTIVSINAIASLVTDMIYN
jgi:hypothetical protein